MRTKVYFLILLLTILSLESKAFTLKPDPSSPTEPWACPGVLTVYILENKDASLNITRVEWTVSNGSFSQFGEQSSKTDYTSSNLIYPNVFWSSAASSGPNAPTGTLKAEIFYFKNGSLLSTTVSYTQKIKSLKNATPPDLKYSGVTSTNIPIGEQTFYIQFSKTFLFPSQGINLTVPVLRYEWTLPEGWKDKNGNTGTFTTTGSTLQVTTDQMNGGTVKVRGINDCNYSDMSNYTQLTFTRNFNFTNYPPNISYGQAGTYTYTVTGSNDFNYTWDYPTGWSLVSGGTGNTITLSKSICAPSATVRVKLKNKITNEETGWLVAPTKFITPEIIVPEEIQKYKFVNIKVDLDNNSYSNIRFSYPSLVIESGAGTNNQIGSFSHIYDARKLEAIITLKGCEDKPLTISKEINLVPLYDFKIDGPNYICEDYHYYDTPEIMPYVRPVWRSSSNIQGSSEIDRPYGAKIMPNAEAGRGTITASLDGATVTKNVYIGLIEVISISGPLETKLNEYFIYECKPFYHPELSGYEYEWETQPNMNSGGLIWEVDREGQYCGVKFLKAGYYYILCRVKTDCDAQGYRASILVMAGLKYSINMQEDTLIIEENEFVNDPHADNMSPEEFEVYDLEENLIYTGKIKKKEKNNIKLDLPKKGKYKVRIKLPEKIETHEIEL